MSLLSLPGRLRATIAFRSGIAGHYGVTVFRHPAGWARFVFFDRETTNFTYDLSNEGELAEWVVEAVGCSVAEAEAYIAEVGHDRAWLAGLSDRLRPRPFNNNVPRFGRRLGWYCLLRATKPALVVETGTADGLGTALLAHGLERNALDGSPGHLLSFDIDPKAGWLLEKGPNGLVELITGDSAETLPRALVGRQVDFFVHDSDHSVAHEQFELALAVEHAAPRLILISDNAHATTVLRDLCAQLGADYRFFREQPRRHIYPGAGIGLGVIDQPSQ
jgi:predicted O-methyltransferase YrrM